MRGFQLDSDVEDTPDKQSLQQLNRARERAAHADRSPIAVGGQGRAPGSAGKHFIAAQAVRRSRLRLASKGSADASVNVTSLPQLGNRGAVQLGAPAPGDATAAPGLPPAQPELAVTPQRPQPRPRRKPAAAKPGAAAPADGQAKAPEHNPGRLLAPVAVGEAQQQGGATAPPQDTAGAMPPQEAAAAHEEGAQDATVRSAEQEAALARGSAVASAPAPGVEAGGVVVGSVNAGAAGRKTVQSKLSFFAPQVRRGSKVTKPDAPRPAPGAPGPYAVVAPASGREDLAKQQAAQPELRQGGPDELPEVQPPPQVLGLQPGPAPAPPKSASLEGAAPELVPDRTHIDLTAAEKDAAHADIHGEATPPGAIATAVQAAAGQQQQEQQDGGVAPQRGQPAPSSAASKRPCRQALLPGAPPPPAPPVVSAAAAANPSAVAADAAPTAMAAADLQAPQTRGGHSPSKRRARTSHAGDAGAAAAAGAGGRGQSRGRGRGRAGRGRVGAAGATAAAAQSGEPVGAILSDDADSIVDDGDDEAEDDYHPTSRGRGRGSSAGAFGRGRGRGSRGGGRARGAGEGRSGRGRRSGGAAAEVGVSQLGGSVVPASATAPLRGRQEEQAVQAAGQQQPPGDCKPGPPVAVGTPECAAMAADEAKENRPVPPGADGKPAAAGGDGGGSGDVPTQATKAAAPVAQPAGPVNEMFLSVAERRRRQKQRQEEEAAAQRRAAEEREQREQEQREREQREAEERQRARERETERQQAEAPESIDLSGSPKVPTLLPVNPFFRARKRPDHPAGGETGGAAKRSSIGGANAATGAGGGGGATGARPLPALAPVHVRQLSAVAGAESMAGNDAGASDAAAGIAAAVSCLLQLDDAGTITLVPSDGQLKQPHSVTACAADAGRDRAVLRFSFLRPAQAGASAVGIATSAAAAGASGSDGGVATVDDATDGCGGSAAAPRLLLQELAAYLAEAQRREAEGADAEAELQLQDFPTREEILRQLTDELNLRRRRVAVQQTQQTQTQQQPQTQQQQAGAVRAACGGAPAIGPVAGAAGGQPADPPDQLWCAAQQPLCAAELCGNAAQVSRLRDWLCQWREVIRQEGQRREEGVAARAGAGAGGAKRQRRGRSFSDDSDFCSDDDSDWDARSAGGMADSDGDGEGGNGRAEHKGLPTALLLRGPSGCGKTAAAYAVAAELGFRVLEVNPSADRSGPQLLRMVGEATKSRRLVQGLAAAAGAAGMLFGAKAAMPAAGQAAAPPRGGRRGKEAARGRRGGGAGRKAARRTVSLEDDSASGSSSASPSPVKRRRGGGGGRGRGRGAVAATAAARLFGAKLASAADAAEAASGASADAAADGGGAAAAAAPGTAGGGAAGSVTLMLFDEVDVLPEEDKGFVSALVSIIQQSKRPIVLTAGRGQLPPALRALGLQELELQPAPEAQILRTVAMACAAAAAALPEQKAPRRQQQQNAGAGPGPCAAASVKDACMVEREVLDLSAAADEDGNEGAAEERGSGGGSGSSSQRQPRRLLLPSLLRFVRGCRGDLRHTLMEAQLWLGGGAGRSGVEPGCDGDGGGAAAAAAALGLVEDGDGNADDGEDLFGVQLNVVWRAVEAVAAAAAAAATVGGDGVAAAAADGSAGLVKAEGVSPSYGFHAVLPTAGLWLPKPLSASTAAAAATEPAEPPPQEPAAALTPAVRQLQWLLYEQECRRVREQQLAARWLELEVARAAARAANRRPRGSAAQALAAEEGTPGPRADEEEEGAGSGGDSDSDGTASAASEDEPGAERPLTEAEDSVWPLEMGGTGPGTEPVEQQQQQLEEAEEGGEEVPRQQDESAGGPPEKAGPGAMARDIVPGVAVAAVAVAPPAAAQQLPQKRRASEAAGADTGACAGTAGAELAGANGAGAKRSRLSRSRPPSRAATPAACSPAASDGAAAPGNVTAAMPGAAAGAEPQAASGADQQAAEWIGEGDAMDAAPSTSPNPGDGSSAGGGIFNAPGVVPSSAPAWVMPSAPPPMAYNPEALAALAAAVRGPPPDGDDAASGLLKSAVRECRTQAALADMYGMLSDLEILTTPLDAFVPVAGACPAQHRAAHAAARPMALGINMALQPPALGLYGRPGSSTAWVLADAVRDQEDMPGRLLSVMAAEAEAAGLGSGEPAGSTGRACAAEAAASAARLVATAAAAQLHAAPGAAPGPLLSQEPLVPFCGTLPPADALSTPWQLAALHGALQATAPGWSCAGGRDAAVDRLGALASICRSEAARQLHDARRARYVRRPPVFCHYLAPLDPPRLAVLHRLAVFGGQTAAAGAEAGGEKAMEVGAGAGVGGGAGGRLRRRGGC